VYIALERGLSQMQLLVEINGVMTLAVLQAATNRMTAGTRSPSQAIVQHSTAG
jgi:hypothetical protein